MALCDFLIYCVHQSGLQIAVQAVSEESICQPEPAGPAGRALWIVVHPRWRTIQGWWLRRIPHEAELRVLVNGGIVSAHSARKAGKIYQDTHLHVDFGKFTMIHLPFCIRFWPYLAPVARWDAGFTFKVLGIETQVFFWYITGRRAPQPLLGPVFKVVQLG